MNENPKLTILSEKLRGKTFDLTRNTMTVGRSEKCDICIKEGSISSHHCDLIRTESGSYILRDNNSTNGTRVNNVQISEQELKPADLIQLGAVELIFDAENDDTEMTVTRTHTINLDDEGSEAPRAMENLSPYADVEVKLQAKTQKLMMIFVGLMVAALVVLSAILLYLALMK